MNDLKIFYRQDLLAMVDRAALNNMQPILPLQGKDDPGLTADENRDRAWFNQGIRTLRDVIVNELEREDRCE